MIKKTIMVLLLLTTLMAVSAYAQEGASTKSQLNVRSAPGTSAARVGSFPPATLLVVEARNEAGTWLLVRSDALGLRGWVSASFVNLNGIDVNGLPVSTEQVGAAAPQPTTNNAPPPAVETVSNAMCTTTATLNLRSTPSTSGRVLASLPSNTALTIEGRSGSWALVRTADGLGRGWVSTQYIAIQGGVSLNSIATVGANAETYYNGSGQTASNTSSNPTTSTGVSFVPTGRSIWMANTGPDVTSGTCLRPPLVMCNHLAAITLNDNGSIGWRGQETKVYTMRKTGDNTYAYSGRNGLGNADITMYLTFQSASSWTMTMSQVFDSEPSCTHTFYYTAAPR